MPPDHGCFQGRIMKCLTFFLLLPETFKKSKKSVRASRGPACYEIVPLALQKKMAAELYPASANTNLANSNAANAAANSKKNALQLQHSAQPPPPPPLQNLNNNNLESANWQSFHPTLRERYMYSDEIDLEADTVLATLYAAKKYIVPALAKACVNFLETSLEAKNACVLLSQSRLFEEPELTQRCWEVIDAQAEMALKSEGFCEIDQQTLEIIVTREALNTKEVVVFEAVLNWAEAECKRQGLPITPRNKRNVLGKALYLVRIPTMTLEEFANGAAQSDILTLEERHNIFLWYTAANKPKLEFPLTKRKGLVPQRCHRFQSSAYRSNQWRYRGRCDSIQFAVDKRIFIAGLGLYGSSCGKAEYSVKIELKRLGAVLAQNLTKFTSDGSSNTFSVWFEHPVQVEQDTFYNVSAILDGNELSYFGQEGMTEVQCGKVTFQFQCSSDSTNGTGVQGGQIPELIFYA
ncbi:BTB/POZ domain-containing protein 6 isoform X3 [Eublepharis macularius]|uniref:BTB/POZ domain-containing protein 6 isoform X3 n=1 Tax=Eublepharis macularius TaxID=481883 RepID=A0AA97IVX4_EUBMA|nr:BTB/POZ domain-containing protein 6 isoform X3 [Eublepharis macularius]